MKIEKNSFYDSDSKILFEKENPTIKTKIKKFAFKLMPYVTGFAIKMGKSILNLIPSIVAFKLLCLIFNIHIILF